MQQTFQDDVGKAGGLAGRQAAFFDVDGTLIRGDTQEMEALYFLWQKRGSLPYLWALFKTWIAQGFQLLGWISLARQNRIYMESYRGMTQTELTAHGKTVFETRISRRIFPGAVDCLARHRKRGDLIVWVSASTRHLLDPLAQALRPDYLLCTDLEVDSQGRATGKALGGRILVQEEKRTRIRAFAWDHGLDLSTCYAYSDHHADIPMLSSVGRPVAVNPTPQLETFAGRMGWTLCRFYLRSQNR